MGFGETAQKALSAALEAVKAIAEVKAIVQQIQTAAHQQEQRMSARLGDFEKRMRELEMRLSDLNGRMQAVQTDSGRVGGLERGLNELHGRVAGIHAEAERIVVARYATAADELIRLKEAFRRDGGARPELVALVSPETEAKDS